MMKTPSPLALLNELHALGVVVSTDGITLTINAPKGVMTPAHRAQLAAQKLAMIALLQAPGEREQEEIPTENAPESLNTSESIISRMVDALGGPAQVTITKQEPGLTLAQYVQSHRPANPPVFWPRVPRAQCPHQVVVVKPDHRVIGRPCQGKPLAHGWCVEHARSYDLLCFGKRLGYPSLTLAFHEIGQGVAQWEAYAECASAQQLEKDSAYIHAHSAIAKGGHDE